MIIIITNNEKNQNMPLLIIPPFGRTTRMHCGGTDSQLSLRCAARLRSLRAVSVRAVSVRAVTFCEMVGHVTRRSLRPFLLRGFALLLRSSLNARCFSLVVWTYCVPGGKAGTSHLPPRLEPKATACLSLRSSTV